MNRFLFGFAVGAAVVLLGLAPGARADDKAKKKEQADPAKEYAAIEKEWNDAQQAFSKAYQQAKTNEERQQILKEKRPQPGAYAERFLKLAAAHPDSPEATRALAWVAGNNRGTEMAKKAVGQLKEKLAAINDLDQLEKHLKGGAGVFPGALGELAPAVVEKVKKNLDHPKAVALLVWAASTTLYGPGKELTQCYNDTIDLLMERFAEREELGQLPTWLAMDEDPAWAAKHLRRLLEKNPNEGIQSRAKFGLAQVLKNKDEASQAEAEKLFNAIIVEYAGKPALKRELDQAKSELEEMKLRGIGKAAPDIGGEDLDGKAFKLTDYKGKVVLLDFWGFW